MLKRSLISLPLMGLVVMLLAASPSQAVVSTFTGGDAGEGLDLDGTFQYAVNIGAGAAGAVRDATFTAENGTPHLAFPVAPAQITNWATPNFGGTTNDNNLEVVMRSIRHANAFPGAISFDLPNLTVGKEYQLQLLFHERCCDRGFDVRVEGATVADDFNIPTTQGGITATPTNGAVVSHTFVAGDTTANIVLDGAAALFPDRNPTLSGFTLEVLPGLNVALGKSVTASSTFPNALFVADKITDGVTSDLQGFQWLGAQGAQTADLVIDLEGKFTVNQLRVLNTGNDRFLDRSTGEFSIDAARADGVFFNVVGPTVLQPNSAGFQDILVNLTDVQFIRYNMLSIADPAGGIIGAAGGGLNELEVIGALAVPEPTTAALALLGIGAMARRRRRRMTA